jgi:hypothetical protein
MTAHQIIDETVAYYSEDPINRRSIGEHKGSQMCLYKGEKGQKCAYSRCWRDDVYKPEYENQTPVNGRLPSPDELVKDEYKGHSSEFWSQLQHLHDVKSYWTNTGLSDEGQKYVNTLKENYN